jgi:two-component system, NarL family, sensor histidine kinase BarA
MEQQRVEREKVALEASRLNSEFLANMSQEIWTPLNGVLGMGEDLMDDPNLTPVQKEAVASIQESGNSKVEAGKMDLKHTYTI